jgi:chromosomal replication initiation ATPase DnaA
MNELPKISPYVYPGLSYRPDDELKCILLDVCEASGVTIEDLQSGKRFPYIVTARHVYCYIARRKKYSMQRIGQLIHRNHSSVLHAVNKIEDMIEIKDRSTIELLQNLGIDRPEIRRKNRKTGL